MNSETTQMGMFVLSSAFAVATAAYSATTLAAYPKLLGGGGTTGNHDAYVAHTLSIMQYVNLGFGGLALLLSLWVFLALMSGSGMPDFKIPILSDLSMGTSQMLQFLGFIFTVVVTVYTIMFLNKHETMYKNINKDQQAKTTLILNYIMAGLLGLSLLSTVYTMMKGGSMMSSL